jgi:hypothetical protein
MAADITVNLNDADEAILDRLTAEWNANPANADDQLTKAQFFRQHARDWIRSHRSRFTDLDNARLAFVYSQATAEEQATIDAIRDKYV